MILLLLLLASCKSLEIGNFELENRSSLEELRFTPSNKKKETFVKREALLYLNPNLLQRRNSAVLDYLLQKQSLFLEKLQKKNPWITLVSNKTEGIDFIIENEYFEKENTHYLALIIRDYKTNQVKKYFFSVSFQEFEKANIGISLLQKKIFISKILPEKTIHNYEEPNETDLVSFIKSSFYGKVYFYSNLPNVKTECNQTFLGTTPLSLDMLHGNYECKFISREGIPKYQRFFLYPKQELKIYQPFFESPRKHILIETLPEIQKLKINNTTYTRLPITVPLQEIETISFYNSENVLDFALNLKSIQNENSIQSILLPFMVWDAFHPRFQNFWEKPKSFGTSIEMNRYLSVVNETKVFLSEWSFLESKPFFPGTVHIEGGFFPAEDTGTGIFQFHFGTLYDYYTIEVEEERVSLFHFPSSKKSIGNYFFPYEEKRKPREFFILTDAASQRICIYLNKQEVLCKKFSFDSVWRLILSFRGKIFNRLNVLNHLKIAYPKILTQEELKIWKQSGYLN